MRYSKVFLAILILAVSSTACAQSGRVTVAGFTFDANYTESSGAKRGTGKVSIKGVGDLTLNFVLDARGNASGRWNGNVNLPCSGWESSSGSITNNGLNGSRRIARSGFDVKYTITPNRLTGTATAQRPAIVSEQEANWHYQPTLALNTINGSQSATASGQVIRRPKHVCTPMCPKRPQPWQPCASNGRETGESQSFGVKGGPVSSSGVVNVSVGGAHGVSNRNLQFKLW